MNYFLALCGLILIIITAPYVLSEKSSEVKTAVSETVEEAPISPALLEYLQSMEDKLGAMSDTLAEMMQVIDKYSLARPNLEQGFTEVLDYAKQDNRPLSVNEQIYQAFLNGKSVTELAQEFGRGKGEIELILNLKR